MNALELATRLRHRILADLHLRRIRPGDRLESIRAVADGTGIDHRIVARAYQVLQDEGLVEVRGRSGVFVAEPDRVGEEYAETAEWLSRVMWDAWSRHIQLPRFVKLVDTCVNSGLKCVCAESTEDHSLAFCAEFEEDFGLDTHSVRLSDTDELSGSDIQNLVAAVNAADFVATTERHEAAVRAAVEPLGKPVVMVTVNEEMRRAFEDEMSHKKINLIVADPRYAQRIRDHFSNDPEGQERIHVRMVGEITEADLVGEPFYLTRAARKHLRETKQHFVAPPPPFISSESARATADLMVSLALRRLQPA